MSVLSGSRQTDNEVIYINQYFIYLFPTLKRESTVFTYGFSLPNTTSPGKASAF